MENKIATFNDTVAVLVKAYFEGVLECTDCAACACGNIVAAANNYTVKPYCWLNAAKEEMEWAAWQEVVWELRDGFAGDDSAERVAQGKQEIASTGYTAADFVRIEDAFMDATSRWLPDNKEEENLVRLLAVVDVLADIHGIDLTSTEAAKLLFLKA